MGRMITNKTRGVMGHLLLCSLIHLDCSLIRSLTYSLRCSGASNLSLRNECVDLKSIQPTVLHFVAFPSKIDLEHLILRVSFVD